MEILRAILLGVVQGLTEFIPVSSEGHLVLVRHILGWPDESIRFDAVLHLGTFLAVLIYFYATWKRLLRAVIGKGKNEDVKLLAMLAVATVPAAVAGYFGQGLLDDVFRGIGVAGGGFLFSAVLLFLADRLSQENPAGLLAIKLPQALTVGLFQVLALLPGVSRSGSTITGGMLAGISRTRAVEFSFLLSLPITGGAGVHALFTNLAGSSSAFLAMAAGFLLSFVSGLAAIHFLLHYIKRHNFGVFILYLTLLGVTSLILSIYA